MAVKIILEGKPSEAIDELAQALRRTTWHDDTDKTKQAKALSELLDPGKAKKPTA